MAVRTMMRVTNPAEGMGAAPMLAAVAVMLEETGRVQSTMNELSSEHEIKEEGRRPK